MPAKPRVVDVALKRRSTFQAQYAGACFTCGESVLPRDALFYFGNNGGPSGEKCCGHKADSELDMGEKPDPIHTDDDGDPASRIAKVMPHGKTAADRCPSCFLVHSPGQDGCW